MTPPGPSKVRRGGLPNLPIITSIVAGALWFADHHDLAVAALLVGVIGYVIEIVWFPWISCGGCDATGRQWSPFGRTFRTCRRCGGLRKQLRWGRRLWSKAIDVNEARK